jgi:hypothetical protein
MGIFDIFKKKEEASYNPSDITLLDLDKGFILDYDLKTWEVKEVYEYDWGNNNFTREYKLSDGESTLFLHIENDDELFITVQQKLKIRAIDEDLPEKIKKKEHPPKKIEYNNIVFFRDSESAGYFKPVDKKEDDWDEVLSWDYYDEEEKFVLEIEQWGDDEFEASYGKVAQVHEFSNILPREL